MVIGIFAGSFPTVNAEGSSGGDIWHPPPEDKQPAEASIKLFLPFLYYDSPSYPMFGVEMERISVDAGLDEMVDSNTYWVRKNALMWSEVEPTQGSRNWNAVSDLETQLINASQNNMEVILIVRSTPDWAQYYPGLPCGPMRSEYFDDFAKFMGDAVARYSKAPYNVKYYEIWNEPDAPAGTNPDSLFGCWHDNNQPAFAGTHYGNMLKVVYPTMKSANPTVQVLVGGLLLDCDPNNPPDGKNCEVSRFLERVLQAGAGNSFDGVSFHAYDFFFNGTGLGQYSNSNWHSAWNTTGPVLIKKVNYLNYVLNLYNVGNKYLINTEVALICYQYGTEPYCSEPTFQDTKAFYAVQGYVAAFVAKLKANLWYSINGFRGSGLFWAGLVPTPSYYAYNFMSNLLHDARSVKEINNYPSVKAYEFPMGNQRIWVLWSADGNSHPVNFGGTPESLWKWDFANDHYESVTPESSMTIGVDPVFLEWTP